MTGKVTISDLALETQRSAGEVVARHKKGASFRLYAILAPCLHLVERCNRDPAEETELRSLFAAQPATGNRRYVERGSDIYQLVCRFVFAGTNLTNATRYAQALREAAKMQIGSDSIEQWLRANGGVNALYFRRPLVARTVMMKTLHLQESIQVSRDAPITLRLRWQPDNTFAILSRTGAPG